MKCEKDRSEQGQGCDLRVSTECQRKSRYGRKDPAECDGLIFTVPVPCGAAILTRLSLPCTEANTLSGVAVTVLDRGPYYVFFTPRIKCH